MDYIKLSQEELSVAEASSLATHPSCGAISLFVGTTRDTFQGKDVVQLEYEAYTKMAEKEMRSLCKQAREKWSLKNIVLHHRLGLVPVTESSVILAVSSEHRRESLDAVSFLIDSLKAKVPIWKKEVYTDGSGDWKKNKECVWVKEEANTDQNMGTDENSNNNKRSVRNDDGREIEPSVKKIKEEFDPRAVLPEEHAKSVPNSSVECTSKNEGLSPEKKSSLSKLVDSHELNQKYIQIVASKEELYRRIAAFQQRKREELDVLNVQEFCTLSGAGSSLGSCARTSAVVLRSKGSNSHLKLTRVVNEWGPQTVGMDPSSLPTTLAREEHKQGFISSGSSRDDSVESRHTFKESGAKVRRKMEPGIQETAKLPSGVEERLSNLESHFKIIPGGPVPQDVYARIKNLEDRVLYLEGISPEYFNGKSITGTALSPRLQEIKAVEDDISVDELDMKIHKLKMKLKQKQLKQVFL